MQFFKENREILLKTIKCIILVIIIYLFIHFLGSYFAPFIFGYILCIILYPLFKFFKKFKIPNGINSILCILILIFIISFIGVGIAGQIVKEAKEFSKELPYYIEQVKLTFQDLQTKIDNLITLLPDGIEEILDNFSENSKIFVSEFLGNGITTKSVSFIKKIPNALMITILGIISCFLILMDKENIDNFILRQIPKKYKDKFNMVKSHILETIFAYIKAQAIIMCLMSTICFIGLSIINAPYALLIAVVIGVIDALPVFGSGFILWPWSIYNLIVGNYGMAIGLIIIYVVILVTRQFVEPRILGKQIGIHPLVTLMSIYIGIKVFGLFGFIIGPCIVVIIKALQDENIILKWK